MTARGDFFPERVNNWFANARYAGDVADSGVGRITIPAMVALDADGILSAQSIASAVDTTTFAATYSDEAMAKFGRNVTVVASGAATSNVTVYGKDYLGQPMVESFTLNGTTTVHGLKAFKYIDRITAGVTAATTINVGWANKLGLPYKIQDAYTVLKNDQEPADADTIVIGSTATQTATSADPRGTINLHANNVPDGDTEYEIVALWDIYNLYGVQHYFA